MQGYEELLHIKLPACEKAAGHVVDSTTSVLDMKGFSMSSLNSKTKNFVTTAISMGQNFYPEIMHEMFIVNAPLLFRGAYAIFKPFIDERTRKKIHIRGEKFQKDLFEKVDPVNVPDFLGGECTDYHNTGPWVSEYEGDEFGAEAKIKKEEVIRRL